MENNSTSQSSTRNSTRQNSTLQKVKDAGKALAIFAMVSSTLVALTFVLTEPRIAENERKALLKNLHELVPPQLHNNDLYQDNVQLDIPSLNYRHKAVTVYRARIDNIPTFAIFSVTAPDGYSGAIKLLIAINIDESLAGVRVVAHKETPGLGDAIEARRSDWIRVFEGKSLNNPIKSAWAVKKDGGDFDQLTGATITPRAIVKITKKTLEYFVNHKTTVFKTNIELE